MDIVKLTNNPLSVEEVNNIASDASCGAISLFIGTTRDHFDNRKVVKLEYEAYNEMAEKEIRKLCRHARNKYNVKNIVIYHRLGAVDIKEASVIVAVSSVHRRESLDAVSYLIDSLKASVPIWKKEIYEDGSGTWKQNKECAWTSEKAKIDSNFANSELTIGSELTPEELTSNAINTKEVLESRIDANFIQINASKEEIERRIESFQKRKREELDIMNIQEFCLQGVEEQEESSCARTSAIVLRSKDSAGHLKFTKVTNHWGPLTETLSQNSIRQVNLELQEKKIKNEPFEDISSNVEGESSQNSKINPRKVKTSINIGIEERLKNMEEHLQVGGDSAVSPSIYKRLKNLEDRILYLEGLSPEYFAEKKNILSTYQHKSSLNRTQEGKSTDDLSEREIDEKIFLLKQKLKNRQVRHGAKSEDDYT